MPSILKRFQSGWNAFLGRDPTTSYHQIEVGPGSSYRPDKVKYYRTNNDRSIVSAVICRIATDAAAISIKHVRLENERYSETIKSGLNNALTLDANIDQTGRALIQDAVMSMCDEGVIAIVPTDTTSDPYTGSYDIQSLRIGKITQWFPRHVKVDLYDENTGKRREVVLPKNIVGIIENPFYSIMNEPNSTLQRLKRTLANLDIYNERNATGKLDLIIQLPYVVKSEARKQQAEQRRKDIEMQLMGSKYGIAYTDGTERITQLNRSVENNYWTQAKELTSMLYNQLGLTQEVLDGTANDQTMNNYYNRTIEPILSAISEELERKFLTKTARSQGQAIRFFREPFRLVPVGTLAELSDKLTRNEIASSNEIRTLLGWMPSKDPKADELRNANISQQKNEGIGMAAGAEGEELSDSANNQAARDLVSETLMAMQTKQNQGVNQNGG